MSNRIGEAVWRRHVKSWKRSGETAPEYGVRHGIDGRQLYWWSWWLRKKDASEDRPAEPEEAQAIGFLPVKITQPSVAAVEERPRGAELVLACKVVLRIVEGSDPDWAAQLVARVVAESGPC